MNLQDYAHEILIIGPDKVMVSDNEAVSSREARERYGIHPNIIFIRNDGWSLGAPASLEGIAFHTWADSWIGFMRKPETTARDISEWWEN